MSKYRCPTLGDCERANSGEIFERSAGEDVKCPGCGTLMELHPSENKGGGKEGGGSKTQKIVAGAVAALVVVGGGSWFTLRKPAAQASAQEVAAAPVAVASSTPGQPSGMSPSESELARQKLDGQANLVSGQANSAEASSTKAASNEMIKVGIAKMAQGKLKEAEKSFNSAIDIDPKLSLGYYNMAVLRLRQNRIDEALKSFEACFMAGFTYFDKLDQDADLDGIRKDRRFVDLVARYRPSSR